MRGVRVSLTAQQAAAKVDQLYGQLSNRRPEIARADDYYRGKQPLRFASAKWQEYHASRYERFSDNWCAPVANSPQERLRVDGFRLDDDPSVSDTERQLWRDWQLNDMESQSSQGFLASIIAARSFVLVWGDSDDEPVTTWERPDQAIVEYDPERPLRRTAALKAWCDEKLEYATLYLPDQVWKFARPTVSTKVYESSVSLTSPVAQSFFATGSNVVVPALTGTGWRLREGDPNPMVNPLGLVPMVEFPNRPMLGGEPLSDITGTIAMQDAINLLWAYLFTAADFASMPARVVMGQEPPKLPILDADGNKVGERPVDMKKLAEDRILWLTGENTKIGSWASANLDVFVNTVEAAVAHIAAQTRTPPHYLILGKGQVNIGADGMKAAETGLVMKVSEQQLFFTPSLREYFRLCALVRGDTKTADAARTGAVKWRDAENRSEAQTVDALLKLAQIGFPFRYLAERYGLSPTELERVLAIKEKEAKDNPLGQIVAGMSGQPAPGGVKPKPAPAGASG